MKPWVAVVLAVLLVGCSSLAPTPPTGPVDDTTTTIDTGGEATTTEHPDATTEPADRPDPESDVIGWEDGYWHDDTLDIDQSDGLNATERDAVQARAMARIEYLRDVEFDRPVDISVVSREEYADDAGAENTEHGPGFEDVRYEALHLVGPQRDGSRQASEDRAQSVLGFYAPSRDEIVFVVDGDPHEDGSNSDEDRTIRVEETTLGHELVHAVQVRHFGDVLSNPADRSDGLEAWRTVIEGEATLLTAQYRARCGDEWACVSYTDENVAGDDETEPSNDTVDDPHQGLLLERAFPYLAGRSFVRHVVADWADMEAIYRDMPVSTEQVIWPDTYPDDRPRDVATPAVQNGSWDRVLTDRGAPSTTIGADGIAVMFAYTARDGRAGNVVPGLDGERENGAVSPDDYRVSYAKGWEGDSFAVYQDDAGRTGYVWRIACDTPGNADEFASGYRTLLAYWGAERVAAGVWRYPDDARFAGTVTVRVEGSTVTIVNEPDRGTLDVASA